MKIKTGDSIQVIAGKDKGREGSVLRIYPKRDKVLVDQINMSKKHMKKSEKFPQGGLVDMPRPIHVSNVKKIGSKIQKSETQKPKHKIKS